MRRTSCCQRTDQRWGTQPFSVVKALRGLSLALHTVRHMRPGQIAWYLLRRGLGVEGGAIRRGSVGIGRLASYAAFIEPETGQDLVEGVAFQNRFRPFGAGPLDWRAAEMPKLWRYNLHYFDYLHWPMVSEGRKAELIASWIAENPPGTPDAWEPYTASLRIANWVRLFMQPRWREQVAQDWLDNLADQAAWLARNLEYHILANHHLKNGKALLFAGLFFRGRDADRWLQLGTRILREQIREQFLPDGGHYELSPMYHALCLEDLLDVWNLAQGSDPELDRELRQEIEGAARRALDFLAAILMPNGDIPLFNDAAFGVAPAPAALFDYGERLFRYQRPAESSRALIDSGYFRLGEGPDRLIIDCGPVSPSYQPGHTHCDMLSYELALDGRPVVVDTGVYDYEPSAERAWSRSTRGHNTVGVDGAEQSEVWGVFRVARRARPCLAELVLDGGQGDRFVGELEGFPSVAGRIRHRREVVYEPLAVWRVQDRVSGSGSHNVDSWMHLHPDLSTEIIGGTVVVVDRAGRVIAVIEPETGVGVALETGQYFPCFGTKLPNQVVRFSMHGPLPMTLSYTIRKAGAADV